MTEFSSDRLTYQERSGWNRGKLHPARYQPAGTRRRRYRPTDDSQGQDVGTAIIKSASHGVIVQVKAKNRPAGEHGIHFQQNAKCDPADFKTARAHFNPHGKKHGLKNPEGHYPGEMKNSLRCERHGKDDHCG
jgi:Cu/Zn superoxide dismutase